jgi:hypothetical protein
MVQHLIYQRGNNKKNLDKTRKLPYNTDMSNNNNEVSIGCLPLILFIFTLWALWFGLPTPWGFFEIDIFPPGIYLDRVTE